MRCAGCGRLYSDTRQFEQVRSLGLALMGLCACGKWIAINQIWRKVRDITPQQPGHERKRITSAHGERCYTQLTFF